MMMSERTTGATTATAQLRHEHDVFVHALTLLENIGKRLEARTPVDRSALAWLTDFFRTFVDQCHHGKEEQHLFPALERRGIPRVRGPLGVMLLEHERGRDLIRAMSQEDDRAVAAAIREYGALLRSHIEKENGVLFPLAEQVLSDEEQGGLARDFATLEQAVVGPGIHERLRSELDRLTAAAD